MNLSKRLQRPFPLMQIQYDFSRVMFYHEKVTAQNIFILKMNVLICQSKIKRCLGSWSLRESLKYINRFKIDHPRFTTDGNIIRNVIYLQFKYQYDKLFLYENWRKSDKQICSKFSVLSCKKNSQNNNTLAYNRYIGERKRYMTAKFTVIPHSGGAINR